MVDALTGVLLVVKTANAEIAHTKQIRVRIVLVVFSIFDLGVPVIDFFA